MKVRDLQSSHTFREYVKVWGEPSLRRRVIVAPKMEDKIGKEVSVNLNKHSLPMCTSAQASADSDSTCYNSNAETRQSVNAEIRSWINERKKIRKDFAKMSLDIRQQSEISFKSSRRPETLSPGKSAPSPYQPAEYAPVPAVPSGDVSMFPKLVTPIPTSLALIADYLQLNRIRLVDLFTHMDKDKNWLATRNEFRTALRQADIPLTDGQLDELIVLLDANNDDQLSYKELARGIDTYTKHSRWQKLRRIYAKDIEEGNESENELSAQSQGASQPASSQVCQSQAKLSRNGSEAFLRSSSPSLSHARSLLPCLSSEDGSENDRLRPPMVGVPLTSCPHFQTRPLEERNCEKHEPEQTCSESNKTTMTGDIKDIKIRYITYVSKECEQCISTLQEAGIFVTVANVRRVLVPPTESTVDISTSTLSHQRSIFPASHPANNMARKRQKMRLKNMARLGDARSPLIFTSVPNDNPLGLPRVARIDFKGKAKEGKRRRDEILNTSPSPCWPQQLLDKVRVCMDERGKSLGSSTLFHVVR